MSELLFGGRAPRLWLRIEQDADKLYYAQVPADLADGFIVNANLIEHSPAAVAAFLDKLERPFVVDPMSYRFARPAWYLHERDGEVANKRNYGRLWQKYATGVAGLSGDPLVDGGTDRLAGDAAVLRFCQNVLEFQDRSLRHAWIDEVAGYVGMDRLFGYQLAPLAFLAPYTVITNDADLETAVTLAAAAASLDRAVIAVVPLLPAALSDPELLRRTVLGMATSGVGGVLVWPVGLSAFALAETPALFTGLAMLVRGLADAGLEVGMLYGGILSGLLRGFGLAGFSHAVMYGETRGLDPTGGRPATQFYFPPLRAFLPYGRAAELVVPLSESDYLATVCACEICRSLLRRPGSDVSAFFETYVPDGAKRPFPTQVAQDLNRFHFLYARADELALARSRTEPALLADLLTAADRYPMGVTRTIRAWAERLKSA